MYWTEKTLMTGLTFEMMTKLLDVRYANVLSQTDCSVNKLEDMRSSESLDGSIEELTRGHGDINGLGWTSQMVNKLEDVIVEKFG